MSFRIIDLMTERDYSEFISYCVANHVEAPDQELGGSTILD